MDTTSRHLLCEYWGCDRALLNDKARIEPLLRAAAAAAGATVVGAVFHDYSPQGVTGVVVVEESHLSIHTWPEYGYAAVDVFTCGDCAPERAHELLAAGLGAEASETVMLQRGVRGRPARPTPESA